MNPFGIGNMRDIRAPHLIRSLDRHVPKQVRIDPVAGPADRQTRLRAHRLQTHQPHQKLHPFAIDPMPLAPQPGCHAAAAPERMGRVLPVDLRHERQVLGRLGRRLVVEARPTQIQQLALLTHAQCGIRRINPGTLGLNRSWQLFF
jgi:hypothetical protein